MAILTEDQIERKVERMIDALDKSFMNGDMTQEQYDTEMKSIDDWAQEQYKRISHLIKYNIIPLEGE